MGGNEVKQKKFGSIAGLLFFLLLAGANDLCANDVVMRSETKKPLASRSGQNDNDPFTPPSGEVALYKVGDGEYTARDMIAGFLKSVLPSDKSFSVNKGLMDFSYAPGGRIRDVVKDYPWLYKSIYRPDGISNPLGIVKRQSPVVVSTGFPDSVSHSHHVPAIQWPDAERNSAVESLIKDVVQGLSSQVMDLTGLPVRYVDRDAPGAADANLRIIYVSDIDSWDTLYKKNNANTVRDRRDVSVPYRPDIEDLIDTKIEFTPGDNNRVDGYVIANQNNVIEMSYCYVWEGHREIMLRALVTECMLRSLGAIYKIDDVHSFLGSWNVPYNKASLETNTPLAKWNKFSALRPDQKEELIQANTKEDAIPGSLSAWDSLVIGFLYHPAVRPGDHHAAIKQLTGELVSRPAR